MNPSKLLKVLAGTAVSIIVPKPFSEPILEMLRALDEENDDKAKIAFQRLLVAGKREAAKKLRGG